MIKQLKSKKVIALLILGFVLVVSIFFIKGETTNKEAPKRATFVNENIERSEIYG